MGDALLHGVPPQGVLETLDGGALEEIEQQSNPEVATPAAPEASADSSAR
ncbi:hypothetical protein [Corynebacterium variabile]|nr:hypothetical protein [Corynebacterium variabile]HJG46107.1 hypothetical protein [Corynebacterium variabile]